DDFFKRMYSLSEDDEASVTTRMGAKIAAQTPIAPGKKTKVDLTPEMKPSNAQVAYDQKGTKEAPKNFTPPQKNIYGMWKGDVDRREHARKLQRPGQK